MAYCGRLIQGLLLWFLDQNTTVYGFIPQVLGSTAHGNSLDHCCFLNNGSGTHQNEQGSMLLDPGVYFQKSY